MIYLELLWVFMQVGFLSIGGGYAAIPVIQSLVVEQKGWLSIEAFSELITIAEITPGPIALNSATFVGIQLAGVGGAIVATLGSVLPACVIVTLLAYFYTKYKKLGGLQEVLKQLRPVIVALIFTAFLTLFKNAIWGSNSAVSLKTTDWVSLASFAVALVLLRIKKLKLNPVFVLLATGVVGLITYFV